MSDKRYPRLSAEQSNLIRQVLKDSNLTQAEMFRRIGKKCSGVMTGNSGVGSDIALRIYEFLDRDQRLDFLPKLALQTGEEAQLLNLFTDYTRKLEESYISGDTARRSSILQGLEDLLNGIVDELRQAPSEPIKRVLDMPVDWMQVPERTKNALYGEGCETISDVMQYTRSRLLAVRNFGQRSLQTLETELRKYGLFLKSESTSE